MFNMKAAMYSRNNSFSKLFTIRDEVRIREVPNHWDTHFANHLKYM